MITDSAIASLREMTFAQVWTLEHFNAAVSEGHTLRQPTPWSKMSGGKVSSPMLALKLSNSQEIYAAGVLGEKPILLHTVAK